MPQNLVRIFTLTPSKFSVNDSSEFPAVRLWSTWGGTTIYTTFDEAIFADKLCINTKKVFYLWDLDWHVNGYGYEKNCQLMKDADRLICRCNDHADKIYDYCGRKPEVLEEFSYERLAI